MIRARVFRLLINPAAVFFQRATRSYDDFNNQVHP